MTIAYPETHLLSERRKILAAALPEVPFDGWSAKTLKHATEAAGFDPSMAARAFPGGVKDLVAFFAAEADRRMVEEMERRDVRSMKVRDRIRTAIRVRLEQNEEHREAIRRALAFEALPQNAGQAVRMLYRTVDEIWWTSGDTSIDFNFYTKRLQLAGVYTSTLLCWLDDHSEGSRVTWDFLDRRIDNVMQIHKAKAELKRIGERVADSLRRLRGPSFKAGRRHGGPGGLRAGRR